MSNIMDLATIIRSKNSGPFEITMDIMFASAETYQKVKSSGVITPEAVAGLYHIEPEKIVEFVWYDVANALKITMIRRKDSGSYGERDTYGAQQHAPLFAFKFDF